MHATDIDIGFAICVANEGYEDLRGLEGLQGASGREGG
jgi:hypothetical protein